jgi:hypothetical protein
MSWFYRFFKKRDNEQTFEIETPMCFYTSGTVGIFGCASSVDPINTGYAVANGMDINSILVGGTAGLYKRTGYASTDWASFDLYD